MTISKTTEENRTVFEITGRIDTVTSSDLDKELTSLEASANVILDFKNVEYISSAGLRVLLKAQKFLSASGSLILINVTESVLDIFKITGFEDILTIK